MSTSDSGNPESWISSFCSLLGHEYFAEVSEDFIEDDFNLTGLQNHVPMYKEALEMILDVEADDDEEDEEEEDDEDEEDEEGVMRDENGDRLDGYRREKRHTRAASDLSVIESSAELLYGLIHQRYITSRPGIQQMAEKYDADHFGVCPRVFCNGARVLPVGCHDTPGIDTVKLFCPSCLDVYTPPNSRFQSIDGAFFGTTFGCLFFMTFPDFEIAVKGDYLNLATTNPIFSQGQDQNISATSALDRNKSRSSSLTSNTQPPLPPTIPSEWIPPPNQPATINGISSTNLAPGLGSGKIHEPKIYGFKISERAKTGPRMKWLRTRPVDVTELDEASKYYEEHGGGNGEDEYERQGQNSRVGQAPDRRKKAVARRRRGVGTGRVDVMETNGLGDAV
ncbi:MAG: casein kinase 2 regulatory subunit [Stictis urceolatum]|nr:casein kinase 2 regulatory subunit [Stictis urceolata]